jgi:hypothetical protein
MSIWFAESFMERYCAKIATGWGPFLRNLLMENSVGEEGATFLAGVCIQSRWICISTAVMPSLVLPGSFRLTLCLMRLAKPPATVEH